MSSHLKELYQERGLLDFYESGFRSLSFREKSAAVKAFAAFLQSVGRGVGFDTLKGVRVSYDKHWIFTCDGGAGYGQTEVSVAALFLNRARRNDKFLFFKHYREISGRLRRYRSDLFALERQAIEFLSKGEWRRFGREAVTGGGRFLCERRQGFVVRCVRGSEAAEILELMLPDPQSLFSRGKPLPGRGLGCASVRIEVGGRSYFFKRYDDKGLVDRYVGLFKKSRGMRVWSAGWGGIVRGLPLPRPIALVEETSGPLVGRSWLVTEFVEGTLPLMELWPDLSPAWRNDLLVRSAVLLGRMHCYGLLHGDTNWDNLLVREVEDDQQLLLVDFDCGRITNLSDARAFRDIQHFVRDLMRVKNEGDERQRDFFVAVWKRWFFPKDPLAPCFLRGCRYRDAKTP